ncbi:hypothetical protein AURDEDRAFT_179010 [Auricularia subglabra TFB-10046 SS5]|nr:hypothetical protein AURDEDRAFT_179010 [Auricularia subglabra TFB-10046 SS5]
MPPIRAPGPTLVRKPSSLGKPGKADMPPPANVPVRAHTPPAPPQPGPMLIDEITTMQSALQVCVVKSAEIFRFQADAARAGIAKHAMNGSRGAAAALHRSVERYQQAYDSLEAEILRAVTVLENDLEREKARIEAKRQEQALATQLVASPEAMDIDTQHTQPMSPTVIAQASVSGLAARRPSAVSLSSLAHRAPPLRLDLSSVLPMSPVTLAPRTGAPHTSVDFQADFMLAPPPPLPQPQVYQPSHVIDLTLDSDPAGTSQHPIDLDAESDLFGGGDMESPSNALPGGQQQDTQGADTNLFGGNDVDGLFNALAPPESHGPDPALLNALQTEGAPSAASSGDILAMFQSSGAEGADPLNFGVGATNTGLGNMDLGGDSYDPALFLASDMPPEMMALMDMDLGVLGTELGDPSANTNPNPGGS